MAQYNIDDLGRTVEWCGNPYKVIGMFDRPTYVLESETGMRQTVAVSTVTVVPTPPAKTLAGRLADLVDRMPSHTTREEQAE